MKFLPTNEQEAWVAIMYASIAADGETSDVEIDKLCEMLSFKTLFVKVDIVEGYEKAMLALDEHGSGDLIRESVKFIPKDNRGTLLCLVTDLMLADGVFAPEERAVLEFLAKELSLEPNKANEIFEVILMKNKGNVLVVEA